MKVLTLTDSRIEKLDQKVNDYLEQGYKILGQPYVFNHLVCVTVTKGDYIRPARLKEKANAKNND
jgi:hypothetical protein